MNPSRERFELQISRMETLLQSAALQENPALWLYENDLRTPAFMLEGLSKMYRTLHNKRSFTKFLDYFKALEDALGQIDFYVSFDKEFAKHKKVPIAVKDYLRIQASEKIESLNKELKSKKWLNGKRIKKIRNKLDDIKWLNEKQEIIAIADYYQNEIKETQNFVSETNYVFTDIEAEVHELRRKLRWLSIYMQTLNGLVKFQEKKPIADYYAKYLTPEIINSPFNKLPINKSIKRFLIVDKNSFLALSWLINELGKIKDNGLRISILTVAFQQTGLLPLKGATEKTEQVLGRNYPTMEVLLADASKISERYFLEDNLQNLIISK